MTVEHPPSANGRVKVEQATTGTRTQRARLKRAFRVRPGRMALPVLLALGVILLLRHFEDSTAAG
jgi:hypothetical protein